MRLPVLVAIFAGGLMAQTGMVTVQPGGGLWRGKLGRVPLYPFASQAPNQQPVETKKRLIRLGPGMAAAPAQSCSIPLLPVNPPAEFKGDPKISVGPAGGDIDPKMVIKPQAVCEPRR